MCGMTMSCCATQAYEQFPASSFPPQFPQEEHTDPFLETELFLFVRSLGRERQQEKNGFCSLILQTQMHHCPISAQSIVFAL